jgi:hypothetical protein
MTIMFAGGMTFAIPGAMPDVFADQTVVGSSGLVSVSSAKIQGASVLEIVIDDPALSALDTTIGMPVVTFTGGATKVLTPAQAVDGKWYSYIVDDFYSTTADGLSGFNFGLDCDNSLKLGSGTTVGNSADGAWLLDGWTCADPDGPNDSSIDALLHARSNAQLEVLNDAPSLNRNSSANGGGQIQAQVNSTADTTVRATNGGATGAWPFIEQVTMASDNTVCYAGDCIPFEHGNMNDDIEVYFDPDTYANGADINFVIVDNGLNIDPTDLDKYEFGATTTSPTIKRTWANQTTVSASDVASSLSTIQFGDASTVAASGDTGSFCTAVTVEETGKNTGVFVSPDANGASDCDTSATATNHHVATYAYGGESNTVHIKYAGASLTMDAGSEWLPAEAAVVTITDPDANRVNGYDETLALNVLNAATTTPYIKMGSPVYLGSTSDSSIAVLLQEDESTTCGSVTEAASAGTEVGIYEITLGADCSTVSSNMSFEITHDAVLSTVTNLTGAVVVNYDVSSIFDKLNASTMTIELGARYGLGTAAASIDTSATGGATAGGVYFNSTDIFSSITSGAGIWQLQCCDGASVLGTNQITQI